VNASMITRDDLWKQYEISVDLYKHYLKLAVEINAFYYAITGAILSYYFAHKAEESIRFALILPLLMSVFLALLFIYGAILNREMRAEVFRVRDALGLKAAPEFAVLGWFLTIFAILKIMVAAGLAGLLFGWWHVG
jgi:hypothetical protein